MCHLWEWSKHVLVSRLRYMSHFNLTFLFLTKTIFFIIKNIIRRGWQHKICPAQKPSQYFYLLIFLLFMLGIFLQWRICIFRGWGLFPIWRLGAYHYILYWLGFWAEHILCSQSRFNTILFIKEILYTNLSTS